MEASGETGNLENMKKFNSGRRKLMKNNARHWREWQLGEHEESVTLLWRTWTDEK